MTLRPLEICLGTLVMAASATGVHGQCSNHAGAGDVAEGEACLVDLDEDLTNGGCNSTPPVFTFVPSLPVTFCGSASTYDIDTNAQFSGNVELCVDYNDAGLSAQQEAELQLMHFDGTSWADITSDLDTVTNIVCGTTNSFSAFAIGQLLVRCRGRHRVLVVVDPP